MHPLYRVYLAGPDLFFPDAAARYARLKQVCDRFGLVGVAPTDGQTFQVDHTPTSARLIRHHDLALLKSSDAVLANITPFLGLEPDSGTSYELGYAAARGLLAVAYTFDGLLTHERAAQAGRLIGTDGRDFEGVQIEDFGLPANCMIAGEHDCVRLPGAAAEDVVHEAVRRLSRALRMPY